MTDHSGGYEAVRNPQQGDTLAVCPRCGIDVTGMALFDYSAHLAYDHGDEDA